MKYISLESAYNKHIANARKAATGLRDLARARAIYKYFETASHPHAQYTYDQLMMNRKNSHQFSIDLMKEMADLCAKNEVGYVHSTLLGLWRLIGNLGNCGLNSCYVRKYKSRTSSEILIVLEINGADQDLSSSVFKNDDELDAWIEHLYKVSDYQENDATTVSLAITALSEF